MNAQGFSLIEVLIAMLVMAIGLTALAQLVAITTVAQADARAAMRATELARAKLEELAGTPALESSGGADQAAEGIERSWTIGGGPTETTRRLRVRVAYGRARRSGPGLEIVTIAGRW